MLINHECDKIPVNPNVRILRFKSKSTSSALEFETHWSWRWMKIYSGKSIKEPRSSRPIMLNGGEGLPQDSHENISLDAQMKTYEYIFKMYFLELFEYITHGNQETIALNEYLRWSHMLWNVDFISESAHLCPCLYSVCIRVKAKAFWQCLLLLWVYSVCILFHRTNPMPWPFWAHL